MCSLTSTAQSASPRKKLSNTCLGHRQTSWRQGNSFESAEAIKASQNTSQRQEGSAAVAYGGCEEAVAPPAPFSLRRREGGLDPRRACRAGEEGTNGRGKVKRVHAGFWGQSVQFRV